MGEDQELPSQQIINLIEENMTSPDMVHALRLLLIEVTELEGEYQTLLDIFENQLHVVEEALKKIHTSLQTKKV